MPVGCIGLVRLHPEAPGWHQLSDLFVSLFLGSILFVALKKDYSLEKKFGLCFVLFD